MNKVQEAEDTLIRAKAEAKLLERTNELKGLVAGFEGKCFGSHTFERRSAANYMSAIYYEKFSLNEENEIVVLEWHLSLSHYDGYKTSKKNINYSRGIRERILTGDSKYNAHYNLYSGYNFHRKEIPLEKFMQLWESGEDASIVIRSGFNGKAPELKMESITQGDHGYEATIEQCIQDMGIEMIDFKLFPKVHNVIEYRTLPLFDKRRWLPKQYAKPILEWQIIQLKKDMQSSWTDYRRKQYLQAEIDTLRGFIDTNL